MAAFQAQRTNDVILSRVLAVALLLWVGWNALDYCRHEMKSDSGAFGSAAWHVSEGYSLYREVWDHKPPAIVFGKHCSTGSLPTSPTRAASTGPAARA